MPPLYLAEQVVYLPVVVVESKDFCLNLAIFCALLGVAVEGTLLALHLVGVVAVVVELAQGVIVVHLFLAMVVLVPTLS